MWKKNTDEMPAENRALLVILTDKIEGELYTHAIVHDAAYLDGRFWFNALTSIKPEHMTSFRWCYQVDMLRAENSREAFDLGPLQTEGDFADLGKVV